MINRMSSKTAEQEPGAHSPVRDLAAQLYVELVGRVMFAGGGSDQNKPNPENLAKLCFKLAEAFDKAEREVLAAAAPKTQRYDFQVPDIASEKK